MKIEFYRCCAGWDTPEFYHQSVHYAVFGKWETLLSLADTIATTKHDFLRVESGSIDSSSASIIIVRESSKRRLVVTERPVLENGHRKMEVVICGSLLAYQRFFKALENARNALEGQPGAADLRFDGILDSELIPFGTGLVFAANREDFLAHLDRDSLFPKELKYMELSDSAECRAADLIEYRDGVYRRIASAFR